MDELNTYEFRRQHPTPLQTLRYVRCGQGWRDIIARCLHDIAAMDGDVQITEIVEKLGGLRLQTDYDRHRRDITRALLLARHRSMYTCEQCGATGD